MSSMRFKGELHKFQSVCRSWCGALLHMWKKVVKSFLWDLHRVCQISWSKFENEKKKKEKSEIKWDYQNCR